MRLQNLCNPIVAGHLRSPLHGVMSKSVMLLTHRGRRSGRVFTTAVSYVQVGEDLLAMASREHTWWNNLRGSAPDRHGHLHVAAGLARREVSKRRSPRRGRRDMLA
jgi:hypothetical protein